VDVRFSAPRWDAFSGSASESSAAKFGTEGAAIYAVKPAPSQTTPAADDALQALGATCATLTPLIRAKMREQESGRVLEVQTDDPAAREGVPAWCRLTGNELLATDEEDTHRLRFFIRKK
jgi:TusA-related sulfurtransferase